MIHSQGTWYCLLPGVLYKKLHGCTLVHTFYTEPVRKLPLPGMIFFQSLLNACDCVTFVSKRLQERVVEVDGLSFTQTAITYAGVRARMTRSSICASSMVSVMTQSFCRP